MSLLRPSDRFVPISCTLSTFLQNDCYHTKVPKMCSFGPDIPKEAS